MSINTVLEKKIFINYIPSINLPRSAQLVLTWVKKWRDGRKHARPRME